MKRLHGIYLSMYRIIGFIFLIGLVGSIIWYGISLLFFTLNKSWAIPLVISPTQDKVLNHQAQVAGFEQNYAKQKVDLLNAQTSFDAKKKLLESSIALRSRLANTIKSEASRYAVESKNLSSSLNERRGSIKTNQQTISTLNSLSSDVQKELQAGLITKEQALGRQIQLQGLSTSIIDQKNQAIDLEHKRKELSSASNTLSGGNTNLTAFKSDLEIANLDILIAQLQTDLITIDATIHSLNSTIAESNRVLTTLKNSPFYLALRNPTNVAFLTYDNLKNAKKDAPIYSCYLHMIFCHKAGKVNAIYEAEEYARHPMFKTDIKGRFIGITFNDLEDSQDSVIFVGRKPLFF